jgi:hypothetical protein
MTSRAERIALAMGGTWHGTRGTFPAPGNNQRDRGISIADKPDAPGEATPAKPPPSAYRGRPRLHLASVSRWIGVEPEPLRFTIESIMPRGMVTLLSGDGGAGKSLIAQMMLTSVAAGAPLFGLQVEGGAALGFFAEDPEQVLHVRQRRICEALKIPMEQVAERLFIAPYAGTDAVLWQNGAPRLEVVTDLEESLAAVREPALLVIDAAALVFLGDEIKRAEVTAFLNWLNGLAARHNTAILLLAHTAKSQGESASFAVSGSSAWVWAARSALMIQPPKGGDKFSKLVHVKSNHSKRLDPIRLEWRDGILMKADVANPGPRLKEMKQAFLNCLSDFDRQGRNVSANANAGNYAPKLFVDLGPARDVGASREELRAAMEDLLAEQAIRLEPYGRPSKGTMRLTLIADGDRAED